jgi:hypothetical protein
MSRASPSFEFVKGEDAQITWTVYTTEAKTAVQDITGWTFALKVKRKPNDADPSLITPTITIISAAAGTVKTVFAAADTASLNGDYTYSFWRTNAGSVTCLALGGNIAFLDSTQS